MPVRLAKAGAVDGRLSKSKSVHSASKPGSSTVETEREDYRKTRLDRTPASVLDKLSTDSDHSVRYSVAGNPNTPLDKIMKLTSDVDDRVSERALQALEDRRQKND